VGTGLWGDLNSVKELMALADSLLSSANLSYQAITPLVAGNTATGVNPVELADDLLKYQPQLIEADRQINLAVTARSQLASENLTPKSVIYS